MGKYMRKRNTKTTGEVVAVLDVSPLGVRTRAKTLALQRLKKSSSDTAIAAAAAAGGGDGCYLQLRSRRLEKPLVGFEGKRQKHPLKESKRQNRSLSVKEMKGKSWNSGSVEGEMEEKEEIQETQKEINKNGSCEGENLLEFDGRERTTRESTPCSLIRDPNNIQTPGSSTRPNNASEANDGEPNSPQLIIPTAHEMKGFFAAEKKQQREFIEKYNFDPVNDKPLPGRYEWVKVDG
ncbi:cyclin-dependent kinase inhibitor 4-like [Solanum dulcamara]|uniref:cyclin-dependent kinase inhibitor 4-like n=1 Tax=Solanum dulcamara TaxID=45834 RepID=UPI002484D883|nr:cyclin-dependent kinase inhibitor 4-like [Solanum dulcamara]